MIAGFGIVMMLNKERKHPASSATIFTVCKTISSMQFLVCYANVR